MCVYIWGNIWVILRKPHPSAVDGSKLSVVSVCTKHYLPVSIKISTQLKLCCFYIQQAFSISLIFFMTTANFQTTSYADGLFRYSEDMDNVHVSIKGNGFWGIFFIFSLVKIDWQIDRLYIRLQTASWISILETDFFSLFFGVFLQICAALWTLDWTVNFLFNWEFCLYWIV